jgi:hypothetical protein
VAAHQLLTDFKKAGDSVRREVLYNILSHHILVSFNKMCFNEPHSQVQTGKHFSDAFPVQDGLQQEDNSSPLLLSSALECVIRKVQEN